MRLRKAVKSISLISVVTRRAMGQALDLVFTDQFGSDVGLIQRDVRHIEDLIPRTNIPIGMIMTIEAPLHRQRRSLIRQRHFVDPSVARGASDSLGHGRVDKMALT